MNDQRSQDMAIKVVVLCDAISNPSFHRTVAASRARSVNSDIGLQHEFCAALHCRKDLGLRLWHVITCGRMDHRSVRRLLSCPCEVLVFRNFREWTVRRRDGDASVHCWRTRTVLVVSAAVCNGVSLPHFARVGIRPARALPNIQLRKHEHCGCH